MKISRLRMAYNAKVKSLGYNMGGEKDYEKSLLAAGKIKRLGVDYQTYIEIAFMLLEPMCNKNGWNYPFYNIVIADSTIQRVDDLIRLETAKPTSEEKIEERFEREQLRAAEYAFLQNYLLWMHGKTNKPAREIKESKAEMSFAAEQYCRNYGIHPIVYNYVELAQKVSL